MLLIASAYVIYKKRKKGFPKQKEKNQGDVRPKI